MRAPLLAAAAATLVVLAGCPAPAEDRAPADTVTPAPVPTTSVSYPPGVTAGGVAWSALADAHERALNRTSYTLVVRQRIVGENRTIQRTGQRRRVLAGGETYAGQYGRSVSEPPLLRSTRTVQYWTGGDGYAARQLQGERVRYLGWSTAGQPIADVDGSQSIGLTARALEFAVVGPTDGVVRLVVTGSRDAEALPTPAYVEDPHNVSGTFRVTADGIVTDWRVAYDARLDEESVRVIREAHVGNRGATTVERPAWVETARNQSWPS